MGGLSCVLRTTVTVMDDVFLYELKMMLFLGLTAIAATCLLAAGTLVIKSHMMSDRMGVYSIRVWLFV